MSKSTLMPMLKGLLAKLSNRILAMLPRQHKAVLGCYKNKFADNSKYLYLHWQLNHFIRAIWISGDDKVVAQLNRKGYEAYHRWSFKGLYHAITAQYYFYTSYVGDVNQYTHGGAIKTNLWHGSPLKKIEFDIDQGPLAKVYQSSNQQQAWLKSTMFYQEHIRPDLVLCPSTEVQKLFQSAFRLSSQQTLITGNPRTDFYGCYPHRQKEISKLIGQTYRQVILYAPTWRDAGLTDKQPGQSPYNKAFNWPQLSAQLKRNHQLLLIRLHPNEAHYAQELQDMDNILDISDRDDVYDLLKQIDLLITDSSSLFIDILPNNTPFRFYCFDSQVTEQRSHYNYSQSLPFINNEDCRWRLADFEEVQTCLDSDFTQLSKQEIEDYDNLKQWFWEKKSTSNFEILESYIIKSHCQKKATSALG
ncbi:CDP-glycerol glycerophosphotransferase family protein [Shewanella waksmanii]|uniref:CDP-glycerol glycerophosphotransferase family protein n=1 Tax=Shewanella waksmanii TaxID=213783 RepID=UPI003735CF31